MKINKSASEYNAMITEIAHQVGELLDKYNKTVEEGKILKEESTKTDFILPLFRALGWRTEDSNEVSKEEKISKKRVDYGFRINGIPKFFLEAKALDESLDGFRMEDGEKVSYVQKAINYAWHKSCTWAVLTNFKEIRVYNAETKDAQNRLFLLKCENFLSNEGFEQLMLVSRESFEKGIIDKLAEKWDKKMRKIPINEQLLLDFTKFRNILSKNIMSFDRNRNLIEREEDLDEAVQRILDRLIFIRNCEDREMEEKMLWEAKNEANILKKLRETFLYFDKNYNSKLFTYDITDNKKIHLCDMLEISNDILYEVIEGLYYTKDKLTRYNFSAIEADVLGNIYEQYLGHILRKSDKRAKITESHIHRKKQGIYYTPTYIVDYIIRNTVCELLKDKKTDPKKLRVLDPACGSGSFLIKAFDLLYKQCKDNDEGYSQTKFDSNGKLYTAKTEFLQNNIFGVDLDKQAVEIAQLNLLLKIAEKGHRLPLLQENIRCGNSLIDDNNIAGDKTFNWNNRFKQIMDEGGFDVIVGNPPYIRSRNLKKEDRLFFSKYYESSFRTFDIYLFFIEKAITLLKKGGYFGFIIPYSFLNQPYATKLRKMILEKCHIANIVDLSEINVFEEAQIRNCIIICRKSRADKETVISSFSEGKIKQIGKVNAKEFSKNPDFMYRLEITGTNKSILEKIEQNAISLKRICYISKGIEVYERGSGNTKDDFIKDFNKTGKYKKYLEAKETGRYIIKWSNKYLDYQPNRHCSAKFPELFENPKIIMKRIIGKNRITAAIDYDSFYVENTLVCVLPKFLLSSKFNFETEEIELSKKYDIKFLLAVLNSKLMSYYFKTKLGDKLQIYNRAIEELPISVKINAVIISLADKLLSLNKKLNEIQANTDARSRIEEEIKKTDAEIDELVYKLYGITEVEKKIIEESLK